MSSEQFLYSQVEQAIVERIRRGALLPGQRLPSLRALSRRMGMSLATVSQAYAELERKGMVEARPRSGYFVRPAMREPKPPVCSPTLASTPREVTRAALIRSVLDALGRTDLLPLGVSLPQSELLPIKALSRCLTEVMRSRASRALDYEPVTGYPELLRQIAMLDMDNGPAAPGELVITNGAMEALHIALRCVTRPGDNVIIQSPTYYCFLQLLESLQLRAIEIPSCPEGGIDPASLEQALRSFSVAACVLTPNFNNPDGSLTSEEAKAEIVELLARRSIPLIEDEVYAELHFGPSRPPSCARYDKQGLVLTCSSFSKTLAPGFRVGWLRPGRFHEQALAVKITTNVCTASPMQIAVAEYLRSGAYTRHLRRLRQRLAEQAATMRLAIGRHFPPGTRVTSPRGGMQLWLELPGEADGIEYFRRARAERIGVCPGSIFSARDGFRSFVRICCGNIWSEEMEKGLKTLGRLAGELTG
ncbi:MAG: PLP-dependent aminotransferase family protein [Desulfocurvibacter africanus]